VVIARRRILDGHPRVIHRSYLNPDHYSAGFLADHDFESESLLQLLEQHGLRVQSRDTVIRAAFPTESEQAMLEMGREPVLVVDQRLYAVSRRSGDIVVAEYLRATYRDWEYSITDRRRARV